MKNLFAKTLFLSLLFSAVMSSIQASEGVEASAKIGNERAIEKVANAVSNGLIKSYDIVSPWLESVFNVLKDYKVKAAKWYNKDPEKAIITISFMTVACCVFYAAYKNAKKVKKIRRRLRKNGGSDLDDDEFYDTCNLCCCTDN